VTLKEGKNSSEIKNIVTTQDDLYQGASSLHPDQISAPAKEVLRYQEAMYLGWERLRETNLLTTNTMIQLCQRIKHTEAGIRRMPGTVIGEAGTGKVIYTPLEGAHIIRDKLGALERFMHEDKRFDPLVRMALMHYQFEAIHPFGDGNGRKGRILCVLYLVQQGLLDLPVLYLSAYILNHRSVYYAGLRGVTERDAWQAWVSYLLEAVQATAQGTLNLIRDMHALQAEITEKARTGMERGFSEALMQLIFREPYCKIPFVVDAGLAARVTASRYLSELERLGILRSVQAGKEKYFINHRLMVLLGSPRL